MSRRRLRVAGIDPSLTGTGVAVLTQGPEIVSEVLVRSRGRRTDTWPQRVGRVVSVAEQVSEQVQQTDLVVMEAPSYGHALEPGFYDRAMLMCAIAERLASPWLMVPPTVVKKWATGDGAAGKALVTARIRRFLPDAELKTSDVADAAAMALIGLSRLGGIEVVSKVRARLVDALQWPDSMSEALVGGEEPK